MMLQPPDAWEYLLAIDARCIFDDATMVKISSLEIPGFNNQLVPNTFYQQKSAASRLAIVLPGYGYSTQMPLLYYATRILLELGADVLSVDYAYNKIPEYKQAAEDEKMRWLMADVTAACQMGLVQGDYNAITLVGKSLGTVAIARMIADTGLITPASICWLTPVLDMELVRQGIIDNFSRSFVAIGTADAYYDAAFIEPLSIDAPDRVMVIENADHGLENKDDVLQSVFDMESVMQALDGFL